LPLDGLEEQRGDVVAEGRLERGEVPEGEVLDAAGQRLERLAVGRLVGERERPHRPAVERALEREDAGTPGAAVPPCQLDRGLDRLGAGVREEHPRAGGRAPAADDVEEPLGEVYLGGG